MKMGFFDKWRTNGTIHNGQSNGRNGYIDRIDYNGGFDKLVWKFPYDNISVGAQLVVNQSQEAVFLKGGALCDMFGPGVHTLSANNIPMLQRQDNFPVNGNAPFPAEVWYVNKTIRRNLHFSTATPIDLLDPFYNVSVSVRSYGDYGVQIADSLAFLQQMIGMTHMLTTDDVIEQFKGIVIQKLTAGISKFVVEREITVVKINAHIDDLARYIRESINDEFAQYGVRITNLNIISLNFDKEDPNVMRILNSQSEAAKRRMEGYTYQQERMFSQQMNDMTGIRQQQQMTVPPPVPQTVVYHVLFKNTQYQHDLQTLSQYVQSGQITPNTLVWKAGMAQWAKAGDYPELQHLFGVVPPPMPV